MLRVAENNTVSLPVPPSIIVVPVPVPVPATNVSLPTVPDSVDVAPLVASTDHMLAQVDARLCEQGGLVTGDSVVFVAGQPIGQRGTTNLMKLHRVGELAATA